MARCEPAQRVVGVENTVGSRVNRSCVFCCNRNEWSAKSMLPRPACVSQRRGVSKSVESDRVANRWPKAGTE